MKIVLVENTHVVREGLALFLREQGHEVLTYGRGRDALGQLVCYGAELAIVANELLDMAGADFAAHLRHTTQNASLPVLVLQQADRDALAESTQPPQGRLMEATTSHTYGNAPTTLAY